MNRLDKMIKEGKIKEVNKDNRFLIFDYRTLSIKRLTMAEASLLAPEDYAFVYEDDFRAGAHQYRFKLDRDPDQRIGVTLSACLLEYDHVSVNQHIQRYLRQHGLSLSEVTLHEHIIYLTQNKINALMEDEENE